MRRTMVVVALLLGAAPLSAQTTPDVRADLKKAIDYYERFNIEAARPMLWSVVRREKELSRDEAASAYKFLGASYAVLALRDSAVALFREALKRDSTIRLDPTRFARAEIDALDAARRTSRP